MTLVALKGARGLSRRQLLQYSSYAAAALAACELTGMPTAYAEANFTIATTAGTWAEGIRAAFIDKPGFERKTGVKVSYLLQPSPAAVAARLMAQPQNPPASAVDMLDAQYAFAAAAGVLQDYNLDIVSNYADITPTAQFQPRAGLRHWGASMTVPLISLTWNTKLASKPTSWHDLWNRKYKGKIGIPDFGWYGQTWMRALNIFLGGTDENIDPAVTALKELVANNGAVLIQNQEQALRAFTTEELVMMPYWNGRTFELQDKGVPVEMAYVPATIQLHNGFVIPKTTKFATPANHFVNNTLDPVLQLEMTRRFRYPPSNLKAKLPADLERFALPSDAMDKVVSLNWTKITEARSSDLERWNQEIFAR